MRYTIGVILTLVGENIYEKQAHKNELVKAYLDKNPDALGLVQIDCTEASPNDVYEAVTSLPFLSGDKLVVLRNLSKLDVDSEKLEAWLNQKPDSSKVIIIEDKLAKNSKHLRVYQKVGDVKQLDALPEYELRKWLKQAVEERGGKIEDRAVAYLLETSKDQLRLSNEIDKLLSFDSHISLETTQQLVERSLEASIFSMLDELIAGRIKQAIIFSRQITAEQSDITYILAMIGWQLHALILAVASKTKSIDEISRESGFSAYAIRKASNSASKLTKAQLKALLDAVLHADQLSKTKSVDTQTLLEITILKMGKILASRAKL